LLQGKLYLICEKLSKLQTIEVNYKAESKMVKRAFHSGKPDQEGEEKLRDSKWTYGNHEIRRISEYNGLVFSLVYQIVSRKTPSFTGFRTICVDLGYSIA
jgi:hypothetical protein